MEDVKRRAANMAALQSLGQSLFYDQLSASAIDNAHALLHGGERLFINNAGSLWGQAHMQRQIVRFAEQLVLRNQPNRILARYCSRDEGIVPDQDRKSTRLN